MKTCAPCKVFKPILQQVASELGVSVQYIDVDADGLTAQKYNVTTVPTLVLVDPLTKQAINRKSGTLNKQELGRFLLSSV